MEGNGENCLWICIYVCVERHSPIGIWCPVVLFGAIERNKMLVYLGSDARYKIENSRRLANETVWVLNLRTYKLLATQHTHTMLSRVHESYMIHWMDNNKILEPFSSHILILFGAVSVKCVACGLFPSEFICAGAAPKPFISFHPSTSANRKIFCCMECRMHTIPRFYCSFSSSNLICCYHFHSLAETPYLRVLLSCSTKATVFWTEVEKKYYLNTQT